MSAETAPSTTEQQVAASLTPEQRQQREAMILSGAGEFSQDRADAVMSYAAADKPVEARAVEATNPVANEIMAELTIPEEAPDDNRDVAAAEAARRQIEMEGIFKQHDIQERAARENWPQEKVESELAKVAIK